MHCTLLLGCETGHEGLQDSKATSDDGEVGDGRCMDREVGVFAICLWTC